MQHEKPPEAGVGGESMFRLLYYLPFEGLRALGFGFGGFEGLGLKGLRV